MISKWK